jgi:hypothetical protein
MITLGAVTWVARVSGTAIRKQKGKERIMGWMFDNVGGLIARLQKPADNCEPFTSNDSIALRDTLRPGDVLLVEGKGHISGSIKNLTQSTWSHSERLSNLIATTIPKSALEGG